MSEPMPDSPTVQKGTITDMAADVAFTLSPMGRERREDREIAYAEEIHRLRHEMRRVIAEREEARKALEWYADRAAGCRLIHSGGDADRAALDADGGRRAREVLGHG